MCQRVGVRIRKIFGWNESFNQNLGFFPILLFPTLWVLCWNILYALIPDQYVTYIDRSVIDNNVERSRGYWNGSHCLLSIHSVLCGKYNPYKMKSRSLNIFISYVFLISQKTKHSFILPKSGGSRRVGQWSIIPLPMWPRLVFNRLERQ